MRGIFRNREYRLLFTSLLTVSVVFPTACFFLSAAAGWLALAGTLLLDGIFLWFTTRRYRELARLSDYLVAIRHGDYSLDVRDNQEGELSILKNDIYKVTLRLSEQAELLQKDKKYLADSLADISHQLKTPLTSLLMMTDLLADEGLPAAKRAEFTAALRDQLGRIEWLVSSLLKLSRIDAGAVAFRRDELELSHLLSRAFLPLRIPMELKNQTLALEGTEGVWVRGDENWLCEALVNILKNCVEHTPEGGRLVVSCMENPIHTAIVIQDSGSGIAPEDLPHIFERFYRGRNASPESVGIGLAMAKAVLLNQDATVEVESEPGHGTRFTIKFLKQIV